MYNFVRIKFITVEIVRVVDEATITSSLSGSAIYFNQYSSIKSTAPALDLIASNDSTYKLDTLTFDKQVLHLPVRDVQVSTSVAGDILCLSTSRMMETALAEYIPGEMAIASDNTNVAASNVKLFSVLVKYHCKFYYRA